MKEMLQNNSQFRSMIESGTSGMKGIQGMRGKGEKNGMDGMHGMKGKNGKDRMDGISVTDSLLNTEELLEIDSEDTADVLLDLLNSEEEENTDSEYFSYGIQQYYKNSYFSNESNSSQLNLEA